MEVKSGAYATRFVWENKREKECLEGLVVDGRIKLKPFSSRKWDWGRGHGLD
jgi:hypothetical protein